MARLVAPERIAAWLGRTVLLCDSGWDGSLTDVYTVEYLLRAYRLLRDAIDSGYLGSPKVRQSILMEMVGAVHISKRWRRGDGSFVYYQARYTYRRIRVVQRALCRPSLEGGFL